MAKANGATKKAKRKAAKATAKKGAAAKRGRKTVKATAARKTVKATSASKATLDVRSKSDVSKLIDMIKGNKITLVLVYADWCGHCTTFKQDIWSKLKGMKNRKLPLAEVNADVLGETPLANAKIDGFPSVVPIGNDFKMATMEDESGNSTNALQNTRDEEMMKALVSSDPTKVLGTGVGTSTGTEAPKTNKKVNNENSSKIMTAEAEEELRQSTDRLIEDLKEQTANTGEGTAMPPPTAEDDLIMSQTLPAQAEAEPATVEVNATMNFAEPEAEPEAEAEAEAETVPPMKGGARRKRHPKTRGSLYEYLSAHKAQ